MNELQLKQAKNDLVEWLMDPAELGKEPAEIEFTQQFKLHGLIYYIFKFKNEAADPWLLGVSGGYEEVSLQHSGHVFSEMTVYNEETAVFVATEIVEMIRAYWKEQGRRMMEEYGLLD